MEQYFGVEWVGRGWAWLGEARHGLARRGLAWLGMEQHKWVEWVGRGWAGLGLAGQGAARRGMAWRGPARHGAISRTENGPHPERCGPSPSRQRFPRPEGSATGRARPGQWPGSRADFPIDGYPTGALKSPHHGIGPGTKKSICDAQRFPPAFDHAGLPLLQI